MTPAELKQYAEDNGSTLEHFYTNGSDFVFVELPDKWTAVFLKENNGTYTPMIQATDRKHARIYCTMMEPVNVPFSVIE